MPGTSAVKSFLARQLGTLATETSPFACNVALTVPTGVSILCSPGLIFPRCASVTMRPIIPCPHIPRQPTLLKKITPGRAGFVFRLDQQRADHHVRAARFIDDAGAEMVEFGLEQFATGGQRAGAQFRAARDDDACRFATRVGINDLDAANRRFVHGDGHNARFVRSRKGLCVKWMILNSSLCISSIGGNCWRL